METISQKESTLRIDLNPENKPRGDPFPKEIYDSKGKNYFFSSLKEGTQLSQFGNCQVLAAFYRAYAHHFPISISPDMIWLLIVQAFSHFVNDNSEKVRKLFVDFEGKQKLIVKSGKTYITQLTPADYIWFADEINKQIGEKIEKQLVDNLTSNFSTTTHDEKTVSQMTIMSAFKCYFDYELHLCGCGFPYINLEGTEEDWINVKKKAQAICDYETEKKKALHMEDESSCFKRWIELISPFLDKIIESKQGKIDYEFWKNMIVRTEETIRYGPSGMNESKFEFINGWFYKFFPYDNDEKFNGCIYGDKMKVNDINGLANQLLQIPFKVIEVLNNNKTYDMVFDAGILGIEQDGRTLLVKPKIGWCVYEKEEEYPEEEVVQIMKMLCEKDWSIKRRIKENELRETIKKNKGNIEEIEKELGLIKRKK